MKLGEGRGLALSPDGKWVLAQAFEPGKPQKLVLLPTGPGQPRPLLGGDFVDYSGAGFFPDGTRIAFGAQKAEGALGIYVQDLGGGQPRLLGSEGFRWRAGARGISPDGKWIIAFERPGHAALFPANGGQTRPITGLAALDTPVGWTPDGRALYVREGAGWGEPNQVSPIKIWRLDPESGEKTLLSEIRPSEATSPGFRFLLTPDAKTYVYSAMRGYSQLYLIEGLR